jgi:hypothetical protein
VVGLARSVSHGPLLLPYPIPYSLSSAKENGPRRGRILALGLCPLSFHAWISFRNRARPMRVIEPREYTLCGQST